MSFQIEGLEEVQSVFDELPFTLQRRVVRKAAVAAGDDLRWFIRRNINSDTGLMSNAMRVKPISYTARFGSREGSFFAPSGERGSLFSLITGLDRNAPFGFAGPTQSFLVSMAARAFGLGTIGSRKFKTVIKRHGARVGVDWQSLREENAKLPHQLQRNLPKTDKEYFYPAAVELGTSKLAAQKPMRRAIGQCKALVREAFRSELVGMLRTLNRR